MSRLSDGLPRLWRHWISLVGLILTTLSGLALVIGLLLELAGGGTNVYASAFLFLVMPGVFVFGLLLMPLGLWRDRVRRRRGHKGVGEEDEVGEAFRVLLARPIVRRRLMFVAFATLANVVIIGAAAREAVEFMDTPQFCGTVCHTVMQPEYDAYLRSPHQRVACVECHIGPGASWAVKAKLDGLRQVWGVITDDFSRPIPSPIHDLRPARDTCEHCHWPAKFHGNRLQFVTRFASDRSNTERVTALLLKVGGRGGPDGEHVGIHWHVSPETQVVYEARDAKRNDIGRIMVLKKGEVVAVYDPPGEVQSPFGDDGAHEVRVMDCVDCHNRPTHIYAETPERAVDEALRSGELDAGVPWIKAVAVQLLMRTDRPHEGAEVAFAKELGAAYAAEHPDVNVDEAALSRAGAALAAIYRRNVYPEMKVVWNTYRSQLGHREVDGVAHGCFRCHDDEHRRADGETLSQDCDLCHEIAAEDERPSALPEALRAVYGGTAAE